jgi:hypothetical protein
MIEEKQTLEEDLRKFPSVFQLARNLATQAWVSGKGVLEGKKLLAVADTAYARLEICHSCEFYKDTRCLKCGCYMDKKAHLELAHCPAGKWGTYQSVESRPAPPVKTTTNPTAPIASPLGTLSQEEKIKFDLLVEIAKNSDNKTFDFNGRRFIVSSPGNGRTRIAQVPAF